MTAALLDRPSTGDYHCPHVWCTDCTEDGHGDRFHCGASRVFTDRRSNGQIGVELVRNDFGDGTTTGTLVDLLYATDRHGLATDSMALEVGVARNLATAIFAAARSHWYGKAIEVHGYAVVHVRTVHRRYPNPRYWSAFHEKTWAPSVRVALVEKSGHQASAVLDRNDADWFARKILELAAIAGADR
jgi:hypothetical protein